MQINYVACRFASDMLNSAVIYLCVGHFPPHLWSVVDI